MTAFGIAAIIMGVICVLLLAAIVVIWALDYVKHKDEPRTPENAQNISLNLDPLSLQKLFMGQSAPQQLTQASEPEVSHEEGGEVDADEAEVDALTAEEVDESAIVAHESSDSEDTGEDSPFPFGEFAAETAEDETEDLVYEPASSPSEEPAEPANRPSEAPRTEPASRTEPAPASKEEKSAETAPVEKSPESADTGTGTSEKKTAVNERGDAVSFNVDKKGLGKKLGELSLEQQGYFWRLVNHAMSFENTTFRQTVNFVSVLYGGKRILKLLIRKGAIVAGFVMEDNDLKRYKRSGGISSIVKTGETEVRIVDDESLEAALGIIDLEMKNLSEKPKRARQTKKES